MILMEHICTKLRAINNMIKDGVGVRKLVNPNMYLAVAHLFDGSFLSSKFFVTSSHYRNEIYVPFE